MRPSDIADPLSVAEVCDGISEALRTQFGSEVWVRGAISGLNRSANGHVYFTLIDPEDVGQRPEAILGVALFANAKFRVNAILKRTGAIRMEDGIEVSIAGSIEHYASGGRVQMIMNMIDPNYTLGRLAESRDATLKRLAADGMLDRNRMLPLPALPLRIGLVTSEGSAAEADFMEELSASGIPFEVSLFDARVQGAEAPRTLARAIAAAGAFELDIVAVVRGGGAKTDLVAFDHFDVAAAIALSEVPVVVGVGHEIDRSICDEVAAVSAKTPTAAAGWVIQQVIGFDRRVELANQRLVKAAATQLVLAQQRRDTCQRQLATSATAALASASRQNESQRARLVAAARGAVTAASHQLDRSELRRNSLDPATVMARGWTITRDSRGNVIHSIDQVVVDDTLSTHTADGVIASLVTQTRPDVGDPGIDEYNEDGTEQ